MACVQFATLVQTKMLYLNDHYNNAVMQMLQKMDLNDFREPWHFL